MQAANSADVLLVVTDLAVGGAENQVVGLARQLARRGWGVALVSLMAPAVPTTELARGGVQVSHLGMRRAMPNPMAVKRLATTIRRLRPQLVHSHMVHANLLSRITGLVSSMPPLVCTSHSATEGGWSRRLALRITDRLAAKTTSVSRTALSRFVREGVVHEARAVWIPNGVDLARFRRSTTAREAIRLELGVREEEFVWLSLGRLTALKRQDRLIQAFEQLEGRPVLALAGTGELLADLRNLANASAAGDRIHFLGLRSDPEALFSGADGFVLASDWEALPLVLIEASSSELPVVSTDVGGCHEIVVDGVSGLLVRSADPGALANAMRDVMARSAEDRAAMGAAGRDHSRSCFNLDDIVSRWESLYSSLGASPRGRGVSA